MSTHVKSSLIKIALVGLVLLGGICLANKMALRYVMRDSNFYLGPNVSTIVLGDSHPAAAVNPDLLKNSVNLAMPSENYLCSYYKLAKLLKSNKDVRNVVIGFSYHNFSSHSENLIFNVSDSDSDAQVILGRYFLLLDSEGVDRVSRFSKAFVNNLLKYKFGVPLEIYKDIGLYSQLLRHNLSDYPFIGYYYKSSKSNLSVAVMKQKAEMYFPSQGRRAGKSELMEEYLRKILDLCAGKNINVYLLNSPLNGKYVGFIPAQAITEFNSLADALLRRYKNAVYLDFSRRKLNEDEYGDGDHLNSRGAIVLSMEINTKINSRPTNLCELKRAPERSLVNEVVRIPGRRFSGGELRAKF
jgi:hypothetical protein